MKTKAEWIKLDPKGLNPPKVRRIKGVSVEVRLSPFDVPLGIRGYYSDDVERFVIEFRYPAEGEPTTTQALDGGKVFLRVGKKSQRLYGVEIDTGSLDANRVALEVVTEAVRTAANKRPEQEDQFGAVLEAIQARGSDVLQFGEPQESAIG